MKIAIADSNSHVGLKKKYFALTPTFWLKPKDAQNNNVNSL